MPTQTHTLAKAKPQLKLPIIIKYDKKAIFVKDVKLNWKKKTVFTYYKSTYCQTVKQKNTTQQHHVKNSAKEQKFSML